MEDPSRSESKRAPTALVTAFDKDVECILADWVIQRRGVPNYTEYLVKWKDLPDSEAKKACLALFLSLIDLQDLVLFSVNIERLE
ncbi:hypothetical protein LWI29_011991 [Acer saccharum]|uniref:Chromo domain-containing protein n=1 Tax=Acer saccharum TaxID=4024 RepID=A0AA39SDY3_ACESA|nr:hypothetical protein LWI29_011991 [Acer saccharum]